MRLKFTLVAIIICCMTYTSNAQINRGKYLIGGNFNFSNTKNEQGGESKVNAFNIDIQVGKVVKENAVTGLLLSYGHSNYYYPVNFIDTNKINHFSAGFFYRKYKRFANNLYFFGEADAEYIHSKSIVTYNSQGSSISSDGGVVSFVPGIAYSICKKMQIELLMPDVISLSYLHIKTVSRFNSTSPNSAPPSTVKGNHFSINTNLNSNLLSSFGIGFKFFFGK